MLRVRTDQEWRNLRKEMHWQCQSGTLHCSEIEPISCSKSCVSWDCDCLVFTNAVKVMMTIQYKAMMMRTISLLHSGPGLSGGAWARIAYLWYLFAQPTTIHTPQSTLHTDVHHVTINTLHMRIFTNTAQLTVWEDTDSCKIVQQQQQHCTGSGSGGAGSLRGVGAGGAVVQYNAPTKRCRDQGRPVSRVTPGLLMPPLLPLLLREILLVSFRQIIFSCFVKYFWFHSDKYFWSHSDKYFPPASRNIFCLLRRNTFLLLREILFPPLDKYFLLLREILDFASHRI